MVNVIGLGYIGLPTALMLAVHGAKVVGTDVDKNVIDMLNENKLTFVEAGMPELFEEAVKNGVLFSCEYHQADIYIIAVPTPYDQKDRKLDTTYVTSAFSSVMRICPENAIIVIESTMPPSSIDMHIRPLINKKVRLAHAPERIIPGKMIFELKHNARTIGVDSDDTGILLKELYASFCENNIILTDIRTAEMSKVVENTYRDINIAFANELAKICHFGNMDVYKIIDIANRHPRVNILSPGPGVGGHCISVDPWFLVGDYPGLANIILEARQINDSMPEFVLMRISEIMESEKMLDFSRIGIYGLTYKENVDDTRESPTLQLRDCMRRHLAPPLKCYDPFIKKRITENQYFSLDLFLNDIDMVVIMVAHDEIIKYKELLANKVILDTRNSIGLKGVYKL